MNGIKNNFSKIIIAAICIIGLASWYLLGIKSDQTRSSIELTENIPNLSEPSSPALRQDLREPLINTGSNTPKATTPAVISNLTLIAVVVAHPAENSSAVIQFDLISDSYAIGESINNTDVVLQEVLTNYVTVALDGNQYQLSLTGGEADIYSQSSDSLENASEIPMTAKEIGNRPQQLDHIISISPENNDYSVQPGLNPALFKAAQFKPGDRLHSINGKDVTNPQELAAANALIASAQTLEFVVLRGGQTVTLYLDIPGKDLSISFN